MTPKYNHRDLVETTGNPRVLWVIEDFFPGEIPIYVVSDPSTGERMALNAEQLEANSTKAGSDFRGVGYRGI